MNPRTRIQENEKLDKKKRRQQDRRFVKAPDKDDMG
jgi:hypothetical protein